MIGQGYKTGRCGREDAAGDAELIHLEKVAGDEAEPDTGGIWGGGEGGLAAQGIRTIADFLFPLGSQSGEGGSGGRAAGTTAANFFTGSAEGFTAAGIGIRKCTVGHDGVGVRCEGIEECQNGDSKNHCA